MGDPFTVKYYWDNVDWAAELVPESAKQLDAEIVDIQVPNEKIIKALQYFHEFFCPEEYVDDPSDLLKDCEDKAKKELIERRCDKNKESDDTKYVLIKNDPIHQAKASWIGHQNAKPYYIQIRNSLNLEWVDPDELYKKSLKSILSKWYLSWHWRAVLPYIRFWRVDPKMSLFIRLCQIRQWELLLCFWTGKEKKISDMYFDFHDEKTVKEFSLVRAPIFGVSHRLGRWDVYRLLYKKSVKEEIESSVGGNDNISQSYRTKIAYLLGRHDCYYKINQVEQVGNALKIISEVEFNLNPEKCKIDDMENGCDGKPIFNPRDYILIPTYHKQKPEMILFSSDNYCKAVSQLSEVLNDTTAKSVLVIAPPGSGKDHLAKMAYTCRNLIWNRYKGNFVPVTLAGMKVEDVQQLLFDFPETDRKSCIKDGELLSSGYKVSPEGVVTFNSDTQPGLVFQALGGALFIDEIDKTSDDVRAMLLRFLESKEIMLPDSSIIIKIPDDLIPLYIFAGSAPRREMFKKKPIDFWTRVSHVVEMSHPLDIGDLKSSCFITKEYIKLFWINHVKDFLNRSGHIGIDDEQQLPELGKAYYESIILPFFKELHRFLISKSILDFVSETLSDELIGHGQPLPSIREVKSIVGRSIFWLIETLLHSKEYTSGLERLKSCRLEKQIDIAGWFGELCDLIESIQKEKNEGKEIKLYELHFVDLLRQTLRKSTVFSA